MNTSFITEELDKLKSAGLVRTLKTIEGAQGARVKTDGREVILLCSNDYLGLANHPKLKQAAIAAIESYGVGAGASRLVSGNMTAHTSLEERIARFKGTESALLFNSGYHANLGVITALSDRFTDIFSDKLNHASIVDACLLSKASFRRYPNSDMGALEEMLKDSTAKRRIIVTDGVFSMDGNIAPLPGLASLAEKYDAILYIDDAHSTGVLGAGGRGTMEHFNITNPNVIQMGTLGKALGTFGAFVACSHQLRQYLISKARALIFTTALPPSIAASAAAAFDIVEQEPQLRKKLRENASFFKEGLEKIGLDYKNSPTQIIPIVIGEAEKTMKISRKLLERGVFIQGIRPPTVPEGSSRLRITISAAHTREDLQIALNAIKESYNAA